jgi:hypothetical protein
LRRFSPFLCVWFEKAATVESALKNWFVDCVQLVIGLFFIIINEKRESIFVTWRRGSHNYI